MGSSTSKSAQITSFRYDDVISNLQYIRTKMIEIESRLSNRCQANKKEATLLQSRCFTFVDPHGHPISTEQLDHQSMPVIIKKFRKDYIPRFLKGWVKIGTSIPQEASACDEVKLKSFVHDYPDGQRFFAYGRITVWLYNRFKSEFRPISLSVRLSESMEAIKSRIQQSRFIQADLELRSCLTRHGEKPQEAQWEKGQRLHSNDTIMSCKFYDQNQCLLVKVILETLESSAESRQLI